MSNNIEADEYSILHALKVRGFTEAQPLSESTGLTTSDVANLLAKAVEDGYVKHRTGRITGYLLTADGRARHTQLRHIVVTADQISALEPAYESFLAPNKEFKAVTTDWQLVAAGDIGVVLPRLTEVHAQLSSVLTAASSAIKRFASYQPRFDRSFEAFSNGDGQALAAPMTESYHDVWMELHEDLLTTLGHERTDKDE